MMLTCLEYLSTHVKHDGVFLFPGKSPLFASQKFKASIIAVLVILSLTAHLQGVKAPTGDFSAPWQQTGKALARHCCLLFHAISLRGTFCSDITPLKINMKGGGI